MDRARRVGTEVEPLDAAPGHLDIATLDAPIALCAASGEIKAATTSALELLRRASASDASPVAVPVDLWTLLDRTASGEAVEWRLPAAPHEVLGCTRYAGAPGAYVLLMRELSSKRLALSGLVQRQRLDLTERLVGSIVGDIRSAVASVVYSAEFLNVSVQSPQPAVISETMGDISRASASLQQTLDLLLDYARLGPTVCVPVRLRDVVNRAMGSLRVQYREQGHRLRVDVAPRAEWVRGNPIVIEEIFVNLLLNAAEASPAPRCVIVTAFPVTASPEAPVSAGFRVCARVWDDGPGIPAEYRSVAFEPFFTTKPGSLGLGLAIARQAATNLDGSLELSEDDTGTCFTLHLPGSAEGP